MQASLKRSAHSSSLPVDSLAYALLGAAQAVSLVKQGTALPQALQQVWEKQGDASHGAMQDIAYRTMRSLGQTDALLRKMLTQKPEARLAALLHCALALLLPQQSQPYANFVLVDQAVNATASQAKLRHAKNLVNAVLRRFLRERDALLTEVNKEALAQWNYPVWWLDALRSAWPNEWQKIAEQGNFPPPLTLRVNRRQHSVESYLQVLATQGIAAQAIGPYAVRLMQAMPVQVIPGFAQGWVSVQDAAAQLAAPLLDVREGMRVLDACAAPGGKTCHLLECADAAVTALDVDAARLQRVAQNLQRLQLQAELRTGDASQCDWWDGTLFDRILADVPCTASGIVRRHPDIRWLRRPQDAAQLAALSSRILDNLWSMLAPGGKLLLVTCSLWPQESEQQAAAFAARQQAIRLAAPGQLLPSRGETSDHDGLFYALFEKPFAADTVSPR